VEYFKNDYESELQQQYQQRLDSLHGTTRYEMMSDEDEEPSTKPNSVQKKKGEIKYDLILKLLVCLIIPTDEKCRGMFEPASGCILVFMPGVPEINRLTTMLNNWVSNNLSSNTVGTDKSRLTMLYYFMSRIE
jgi:HrpA-like RNA helicase